MEFSVESVDLADLAGDLQRSFSDSPPRGYVLGRSEIRDAVIELLDCSQLQAEELVDTMISLGYAHFDGSPNSELDDMQPWRFVTEVGAD